MRCPNCKVEFTLETTTMPFCSARCRDIDLGRWLDESYALPHVPAPEDDEEPEEDWAPRRPAGTEETR